jgi:hypothetical protein
MTVNLGPGFFTRKSFLNLGGRGSLPLPPPNNGASGAVEPNPVYGVLTYTGLQYTSRLRIRISLRGHPKTHLIRPTTRGQKLGYHSKITRGTFQVTFEIP